MVTRRDATALIAAMGLGPAVLPWREAGAGEHARDLPTDPVEQNAARVRILGRTDEGESYWQGASRIYALTPDGVTPLLESRGGERSWWRPDGQGIYRRYPSSINFFIDPETGAFIDAFENPLTGRTVRLEPALQRRQDGEVFTPRGSYFPNSRARFPEMYDDQPLDLDWRVDNGSIRLFEIEKFAPVARRPIYETYTYFAPAGVALDESAVQSPAVRAGWFVGSFSHWLDMADVEGYMVWHFESTKVFTLEDLGEDYIAHARARNPLFDVSPEFDEGPDYLETVERRRSAKDRPGPHSD